jgi:hypothetical protein
MRPLHGLVPLVCVLAIGVAPPALASRLATRAEAEPILNAAEAADQRENQFPCELVTISTTDATWASFTDDRADCLDEPGVMVFHLREGEWELVARTADPDFGRCPVATVPEPVSKDLGLCRPPSTRVYVPDLHLGEPFLAYEPRGLPQGAHGSFEHLVWHQWGEPVAWATGIFDYQPGFGGAENGESHFDVPIRIHLSRLGFCDETERTYRVETVEAIRPNERKRPAFPTGRRGLPCTW